MRRRDDKFPDNGFEAWGGYMQAKVAKLEEQFMTRKDVPKLSNIFNGISIYVNGFTNPSADELKELMSRHGGVYHTYQRKEDFIIASNLPDTKVKNMSLVKVVRPEWITESIASNRLLDYRDFILYKNSKTQPGLNFKNISKSETFKANVSNNDIKREDQIDMDKSSLHENKVSSELKLQPDLRSDQSKLYLPENNGNKFVSKTENIATRNDIKKNDYNTKTASDPNFISEFYNNSRLHHISQLGACFKQYVNELRESSNFQYPARVMLKERILGINKQSSDHKLKFERGKAIMHIDMDCFFVSVGLRKRPELRGKPVAVTHSKGGQMRHKRPGVNRSAEFQLYKEKQANKFSKALGLPCQNVQIESRIDNIGDEDDKYGSMSEIASCSYEARAKGVGNGMFMGAALRLCPDLQTIPYDFEGYKEVAYELYNTIAQYSLDIEAVSCDEMYVDCTELLDDLCVSVEDFATVLRNEIKHKTGCPCSTGFGGNRLQARLATKKAKPDGQFFLTEDLVEDFIFDIKLKDLPGVGRQISQKLESLGHHTCGSLQSLTLASLKQHFGNKTGAQLFDQCRGRDLNPLVFHTVRKSVSAEVNYGIRFENNDQCMEFLKQLSGEVHSRMQQFKVLGQCITLKLMVRAEEAPIETAKFMGHGFCNVFNKSTNLANATNDLELITKEVISLCKKQNIDPSEMRGIGIQITKLVPLHNNKPTKGTLTKFFSNTKIVKNEYKIENTHQLSSNNLSDCNNVISVKSKPITPKKLKANLSPCKKSPILGAVKSPARKRRGRPKNSKPINSAAQNLMNKFLLGQDSVNKQENVVKQDVQDCFRKQDNLHPIQLKKNDMPERNRHEKDKPKGLLALPWEKIRELLMAWLDSGQAPMQCDVHLIANYMQEMVVNKNIDKLYILLNFLRRRTREINDEMWITVYEFVLEQVQTAMLAVYGKKLYI